MNNVSRVSGDKTRLVTFPSPLQRDLGVDRFNRIQVLVGDCILALAATRSCVYVHMIIRTQGLQADQYEIGGGRRGLCLWLEVSCQFHLQLSISLHIMT